MKIQSSLSSLFINQEFTEKIVLGCLFISVLCSTFSIALTQIAYYSAFIIWLGLIIFKKEKLPKTPLDLFLILYFIIEIVTALLSIDRLDAFLHVQKRILLIPIVYLIVRFIDNRERFNGIVIALMFSASIVGIINCILILTKFSDYAHYILRFSEHNNPMTYGGLTMILSLLMIPFFLNPSTPIKIRLLSAVGVIVNVFTLIFTYTRSSWLGFVAGVIVIAIIKDKRILYFIGASIVLLMLFGTPELYARFFSIFNPYAGYNAERLVMWSTGINIFKDYPIFGVGDISFDNLTPRYTKDGWAFGHLHNNLLQWLVTFGIIGLAIMISLFVAIWRIFWKTNKQVQADWLYGSVTTGAIAIFIGFHINGLFEWNFGDAEIYFLVLMIIGVVLSIQRLVRET